MNRDKHAETKHFCWWIVVCWLVVLALWYPVAAVAQSQTPNFDLRCQVVDENGKPIARVEVVLHLSPTSSQTVYTDTAGRFEIRNITSPQIHLSLSKPSFFLIEDRVLDLESGETDVMMMLNHETEIHEKLEVKSEPVQIDPDTTSHQESLVQHEILNTPVASSHDLQQSLRTIPQVLADPNGRLHVAGGRQGQTEVLLDGFEINDPANGNYTIRTNIDTVQTVSVETGGYGAQYAHASAGIISLDTQSGDDHFRFGVTNFVPGVNFQSGAHFADWYPRATFSGPIVKGKAWFSEAMSLQHSFRYVRELPKGQNIDTQWAEDNLLRAQVNLSPTNILQGSFLYNHLSDPRQGLGPFSPLSTTSNAHSNRYFISAKDQIWVGKTLFDVGGAVDTGGSSGVPQGNQPYVITPSITSGNYFQSFSQSARRLQMVGNMTTGQLNWFGTHTFSAGVNAASMNFDQRISRSQIDYERADASSSISEIATFSGPGALRITNTQLGGYAQDVWRPIKPIVFSVGLRADWDRLIHSSLVEPRIAMNWVPLDDGRMKFTLAWGEHYQPLSLAVFAQGSDQARTDQFYSLPSAPCTPPACPPPVPSGPPVTSTFVAPLGRLSQPKSYNTTVEWQERFFASTFVGASFLHRESRDGFAWVAQPSGTLLLENGRQDRYISGEVWVRHAFGDNGQIEVNYVRSRASSTQVLDPTLVSLILAPQQGGPLLWDAPNRVVSSGWTPIPIWGLLLSGFLDYHTGFPFSELNELQQLVGAPNRLRFPDFFNLNLGLEKRFPFRGHEWAVRVTAINITGHNNPDSVVNNVDAPNYLTYAGGQRRAFTIRLRLVTQH